MSDPLAEAALRHAHAFPGFTLLAAEACGIPASALTLDVLAEMAEELEASAKYALRAMLHGIETVEDLQYFLGLEESDTLRTVAGLLNAEYLTYHPSTGGGPRHLELTPDGREAAVNAQVRRPTSTTIPVVYDRLTAKVTAWRKYALRRSHRARSDAGRILLPPASSMPVRATDLSPTAVAAVLGKRVDDDIRILGISAVTENPKFYYDATLLVYKDSDSDLIRLGVDVDGEWSEAHTAVLDRMDAVSRLGLSAAPVERRYEPVAVPGKRLDKAHVLAIQANATQAGGPDREDGDALDRPTVRWLGGYEHPYRLDAALSRSGQRLLISSQGIRRAVVDDLLVRRLEKVAQTAHVTIAWCDGDGSDREALDQLQAAARRSKRLAIVQLEHINAGILVGDDYYIATNFPWLAHRGGPSRAYRLHEGDLVHGQDLADRAYDTHIAEACTSALAIVGTLPAKYQALTGMLAAAPPADSAATSPKAPQQRTRTKVDSRQQRRKQAITGLIVGQIITGTVKSMEQFGAFVGLGEVDGLVHNSRLANRPIRHPSQIVSIGDTVVVRVVEVDAQRERVSLALERNLGSQPEEHPQK